MPIRFISTLLLRAMWWVLLVAGVLGSVAAAVEVASSESASISPWLLLMGGLATTFLLLMAVEMILILFEIHREVNGLRRDLSWWTRRGRERAASDEEPIAQG